MVQSQWAQIGHYQGASCSLFRWISHYTMFRAIRLEELRAGASFPDFWIARPESCEKGASAFTFFTNPTARG